MYPDARNKKNQVFANKEKQEGCRRPRGNLSYLNLAIKTQVLSPNYLSLFPLRSVGSETLPEITSSYFKTGVCNRKDGSLTLQGPKFATESLGTTLN